MMEIYSISGISYFSQFIGFFSVYRSNLAAEGFLADENFTEEEEEDLFIDMDM